MTLPSPAHAARHRARTARHTPRSAAHTYRAAPWWRPQHMATLTALCWRETAVAAAVCAMLWTIVAVIR